MTSSLFDYRYLKQKYSCLVSKVLSKVIPKVIYWGSKLYYLPMVECTADTNKNYLL